MPFGLDLKTALVTAALLLFILPMLQGVLASKRRAKAVPA
jgi:hypothetical protein